MGDVPMGMPAAVGQPNTQLMSLLAAPEIKPAHHGYYTHYGNPVFVTDAPREGGVNMIAKQGKGRVGDYEAAARASARAYGEVMAHRYPDFPPEHIAEMVEAHYELRGPAAQEAADRSQKKLYVQLRNAHTRGGVSEDLRPFQWTESKAPPNIHPGPIDYSHLPGYKSVTGKRRRRPTG